MLVIYLKQQYNKFRSQLTEYFFPLFTIELKEAFSNHLKTNQNDENAMCD